MWNGNNKFYVKQVDSGFSVFKDPGVGNDRAIHLALFQTQWAANEFCRFCNATEPPFYNGVITSSLSLNGGYVTSNIISPKSFIFGNTVIAKFDSNGTIEDFYLGSLFACWIRLKYRKYVKSFLTKLWYGVNHDPK